jgi:succinate-acetate transporter protein
MPIGSTAARAVLLFVVVTLAVTGAVLAVRALLGEDAARYAFGYLLGLWAGWVAWGKKAA